VARRTRNTEGSFVKDSPTIEDSRVGQLKEMKSFKGAKTVDTEWLKKKHAVREQIDPFYAPYEPGVKR
jgi:hypothetical protein